MTMTSSHHPILRVALLFAAIFPAFLIAIPSTIAADQNIPPSSHLSWEESVVVNRRLPPYKFAIESTGEGEVTIKISGGPRFYRGQTITAPVDDEKRPGFETCDVNLDGYEDFRLVANRGATGNIDYDYWVFDPKKGVFKNGSAFDDITFIDEKRRILVMHSKGGNIETITQYSRISNGRPMLFQVVETTWVREARDIVPAHYLDDTPIRITRMYRNGKLRRTFYTVNNFNSNLY
jgi:hypothetical protein